MEQKGYTNKEFRIQECTLISKNTYDRIIGEKESLFDKLTGRKERENKLDLENNGIQVTVVSYGDQAMTLSATRTIESAALGKVDVTQKYRMKEDGYFVAYQINAMHDYRDSDEKMMVYQHGDLIDIKTALADHSSRGLIAAYMLEMSAEDMRKDDLYLALVDTYKEFDPNPANIDRAAREVLLLTKVDPTHPTMDLTAGELGYAIQEQHDLLRLTKKDVEMIQEKVQALDGPEIANEELTIGER